MTTPTTNPQRLATTSASRRCPPKGPTADVMTFTFFAPVHTTGVSGESEGEGCMDSIALLCVQSTCTAQGLDKVVGCGGMSKERGWPRLPSDHSNGIGLTTLPLPSPATLKHMRVALWCRSTFDHTTTLETTWRMPAHCDFSFVSSPSLSRPFSTDTHDGLWRVVRSAESSVGDHLLNSAYCCPATIFFLDTAILRVFAPFPQNTSSFCPTPREGRPRILTAVADSGQAHHPTPRQP